MDEVLKINLAFDKHYVEKPELFVKLLKERMDNFMKTELKEVKDDNKITQWAS